MGSRPARATTAGELAALAAIPAGHHGGGVRGAAATGLVVLVALIAWLVSLYVHPFTRCGRCKGTGVNKGSTGKRFGLCKACGGSRRRQRFGSRTLHRAIQSGQAEWQRERARRRERRVQERTRNPRGQGGS